MKTVNRRMAISPVVCLAALLAGCSGANQEAGEDFSIPLRFIKADDRWLLELGSP